MRARYVVAAIARARHRLNRLICHRLSAAAQVKARGSDQTIFALMAVGAGLASEAHQALTLRHNNLRATIEAMYGELAELVTQRRESVLSSGVRLRRLDYPRKRLAGIGTIGRLRLACPEMERRWFGNGDLIFRSSPGASRSPEERHLVERHARLFDILVSLNDKGISDRELVCCAIEIDDLCIAWLHWHESFLARQNKVWGDGNAPRACSIADVRAKTGDVSIKKPKKRKKKSGAPGYSLSDELRLLKVAVQHASTDVELMQAWLSVSPHAHEFVIRASGDRCLYRGLLLQQMPLIESIKIALGRVKSGQPLDLLAQGIVDALVRVYMAICSRALYNTNSVRQEHKRYGALLDLLADVERLYGTKLKTKNADRIKDAIRRLR